MGVRGLHKFLTENGGDVRINVRQQITEWKIVENADPILVFDVMGIVHSLRQHRGNSICGGRHWIAISNWERIFNGLISCGAKLVFFLNGRVPENRTAFWSMRNEEKYENIINVLHYIEFHHSIVGMPTYFEVVANTNINKALNKLCKKVGSLQMALQYDCDLEMAVFAVKNNAMAIVAEDSDFLIYPGKWKYWSWKSFNLSNDLSTIEYSRSRLRNVLQLSENQMPLFGTLCGNDVVRREKLNFRKNHISSVGKFVSRCWPLNDSSLQYIANCCFKNGNDPTNVDQIRKSLSSYDVSVEISVIPKDRKMLINNLGFLINLLDDNILYVVPLSYFDFQRNDFQHYVEAEVRLIKRQVGILLKNRKQLQLKRTIFSKFSHSNPPSERVISPEYPLEEIPNPLMLSNGDIRNAELDANRLRLLSWLITGDLDAIALTIENIPKGFVVVLLTLLYLITTELVTVVEADAILLTIYHVQKKQIPSALPCPQSLQVRNIIIAHLYTKFHIMVLECLELLGLHRLIDQLIFDGVYFQRIIADMQANNTDRLYLPDMKDLDLHRRWYCSENSALKN